MTHINFAADFGARSLGEEIYGRPPTLKMFISSKMRGGVLTVERVRAAAAVETLPKLAHAWYWERDAHAGPYCSEEICLGHAATADGLILILADDLTPITRREFEIAYDQGVPVYLFLDQRAIPDADAQEFISEQQQNARRVTTKGFNTVGELETHIQDALQHYAVRAVRMLNFERAQHRGGQS